MSYMSVIKGEQVIEPCEGDIKESGDVNKTLPPRCKPPSGLSIPGLITPDTQNEGDQNCTEAAKGIGPKAAKVEHITSNVVCVDSQPMHTCERDRKVAACGRNGDHAFTEEESTNANFKEPAAKPAFAKLACSFTTEHADTQQSKNKVSVLSAHRRKEEEHVTGVRTVQVPEEHSELSDKCAGPELLDPPLTQNVHRENNEKDESTAVLSKHDIDQSPGDFEEATQRGSKALLPDAVGLEGADSTKSTKQDMATTQFPRPPPCESNRPPDLKVTKDTPQHCEEATAAEGTTIAIIRPITHELDPSSNGCGVTDQAAIEENLQSLQGAEDTGCPEIGGQSAISDKTCALIDFGGPSLPKRGPSEGNGPRPYVHHSQTSGCNFPTCKPNERTRILGNEEDITTIQQLESENIPTRNVYIGTGTASTRCIFAYLLETRDTARGKDATQDTLPSSVPGCATGHFHKIARFPDCKLDCSHDLIETRGSFPARFTGGAAGTNDEISARDRRGPAVSDIATARCPHGTSCTRDTTDAKMNESRWNKVPMVSTSIGQYVSAPRIHKRVSVPGITHDVTATDGADTTRSVCASFPTRHHLLSLPFSGSPSRKRKLGLYEGNQKKMRHEDILFKPNCLNNHNARTFYSVNPACILEFLHYQTESLSLGCFHRNSRIPRHLQAPSTTERTTASPIPEKPLSTTKRKLQPTVLRPNAKVRICDLEKPGRITLHETLPTHRLHETERNKEHLLAQNARYKISVLGTSWNLSTRTGGEETCVFEPLYDSSFVPRSRIYNIYPASFYMKFPQSTKRSYTGRSILEALIEVSNAGESLSAENPKTKPRSEITKHCFRAMTRRKKGYATKYLCAKRVASSEQITVSDSQIISDKVYIEENPELKLTQPPVRQSQLRQLEADTPGRVSDAIGDPPGQQSIYIPPGDVRRETYRLSTFEHFPVTCSISRKSLAKAGFYFTGYFDRVKCFACGRTVESWVANDDPTDRRWHKPDCPLPRGDPCGNIPVQELFSRLRFNGQNTEHGQTSQRRGATQNTTTVRYPQDVAGITNPGGNIQVSQGSSVNIQTRPSPRPNPPTYGSPSAAPQAQRWRMANVVSADHRRFLMNLYLNRELDRLASFARWSMSRPNVSPAALAKSGFFYLGDMDRTQCFSCGGVLRNWTIEDEAEEEHRTHFPTCRMVQGLETRNVPIPQQNETPEERLSLYPCRFSASPHMRNEATRRDTFQHGWPYGSTSATPAAIAQGGFFYLGERDRVKCWYCNGGLQNWEYDDDPWEEHAKWFPNCQFLLQTKGQNFVYRHLSANPHLARPIIAKQEGSTIDSEPGEARGYDIPPSESRNVTQPIESPTIIDPREEIRKKKERIDGIVRNSEIVRNVIAMGFSEQVVRSLLEERIDSGQEANSNGIFGSVSDLLDAVMSREAEDMNVEESNQTSISTNSTGPSMNPTSLTSSLGPPAASGSYNVSYTGEDERMDDREHGSVASPQLPGSGQESLEEQLRKIEEERMCKICFTNMADMVYVPCGHMCCCMECTKAINKCPMCRKKIDKAIKTYVT